MRFGRIMLGVGVVATLGLVAAGVHGYLGLAGGERSPGLTAHVLVGLVALLLFVLAHVWVVVYLLGMGRVLRRSAREVGREAAMEPDLRAFGALRVLPPVAAVVAGIAVFVLGTAVYAGRASGTLHGAALWATVALQVWATRVEWRALAASERALGALRS